MTGYANIEVIRMWEGWTVVNDPAEPSLDPSTFAGCDPLDPQRTPGVQTSSPDNPMDPSDRERGESNWAWFKELSNLNRQQNVCSPDHPAGHIQHVSRRSDGRAQGEPVGQLPTHAFRKVEK